MKKASLIWLIIVSVILSLLIYFNYKTEKDKIPLSDIFPEEETYSVNVEYEFVGQSDNALENSDGLNKNVGITVDPSLAEEPIATEVDNVVLQQVKQIHPITADVNFKYTVQIASFKTIERANKELDLAIKNKLDAFILKKDLGSAGVWYRVYAGKFIKKDEVTNYLNEVKKFYKDCFIISL